MRKRPLPRSLSSLLHWVTTLAEDSNVQQIEEREGQGERMIMKAVMLILDLKEDMLYDS